MKNNSLNVGYMKKYIFLLVLYGSQKAITSILPIKLIVFQDLSIILTVQVNFLLLYLQKLA